MSEVSPVRRRHPLWWLYFGYFVLALLGGTYMQFATSALASTPPRMQFFSAMSVLFDVVGLVGLYCFLRYKPLVSPAFWMVFSFLFFCRFAVGLYMFTYILMTFHWQGDRESYVSLLGVVGALLGLPALAAYWLYAFRSPEVWERRG